MPLHLLELWIPGGSLESQSALIRPAAALKRPASTLKRLAAAEPVAVMGTSEEEEAEAEPAVAAAEPEACVELAPSQSNTYRLED